MNMVDYSLYYKKLVFVAGCWIVVSDLSGDCYSFG